MILLPMVAGAETVEIDGIYYELVSETKEATVKKIPSGSNYGSVVIPASVLVDGKLKFSCETEDVEFVYGINSTYSVHGVGSEVLPVCKCTVTVYATKQDYDNSDVATLEFTLGAGGEVCDTNKDGVVDVADIATIISKMASQARMQEETEESE